MNCKLFQLKSWNNIIHKGNNKNNTSLVVENIILEDLGEYQFKMEWILFILFYQGFKFSEKEQKKERHELKLFFVWKRG